jgi:hypothetical protein
MKLRSKALAAAATVMAVGSLSLGAAAPASAINRATPCNANDTGNFLEFYSTASTCWANSGDTNGQNINLYSVTDVYSGNNAGAFYDVTAGGYFVFGKWTHIPANANWSSGHHITWICIEPDSNC